MAKVPDFRRLMPEDFKEHAWIGRLINPLNQVLEEITRAFNRSLTISENFQAITRDITVDGTYPVKVGWSLRSRPTIAFIGAARGVNDEVVNAAYSLVWSYDGESIIIDNIPGLPAGRFSVKLVALAG